MLVFCVKAKKINIKEAGLVSGPLVACACKPRG